MSDSSQSNVNSTGRCGWCGTCNSFPPWAPERLRHLTLEERDALANSMKKKQLAFIAKRNTNIQTFASDITLSNDTPRSTQVLSATVNSHDDIQENIDSNGVLKEVQSDLSFASDTSSEQNGSVHHRAEHDETTKTSVLESMTSASIKEKREHPILEQSIDQGDDSTHLSELQHVSVPASDSFPPTQPSPVASPSLKRRTSKRSWKRGYVDSDAESFHTAGEENSEEELSFDSPNHSIENSSAHIKASADENDSEDDEFEDWIMARGVVTEDPHPETKLGSSPELEEVPLSAYENISQEQRDKQLVDTGMTTTNDSSHKSTGCINGDDEVDNSKTKAVLTSDENTVEIPTMPMSAIENGTSYPSISFEYLEDSVSARRTRGRGHSRRNSTHFQEYGLPSDLITLGSTEISLDSCDSNAPMLNCEDCKAWRRRVEELQTKVEELTSALATKDMELASARSRQIMKGRDRTRNETRLLQECESLRVTTEFLVSFALLQPHDVEEHDLSN